MATAALALALAGAASAATTIQADFDAAQAKLDARDYAGARDAFSTLLTRFPADSKSRAASLVRARLGTAMLGTGDEAGAERMLRTAIAGFSAATPQDNEERGVATLDLGRSLEAQGLIDSAAAQFRAVLAAKLFDADTAADISLRAALARTRPAACSAGCWRFRAPSSPTATPARWSRPCAGVSSSTTAIRAKRSAG